MAGIVSGGVNNLRRGAHRCYFRPRRRRRWWWWCHGCRRHLRHRGLRVAVVAGIVSGDVNNLVKGICLQLHYVRCRRCRCRRRWSLGVIGVDDASL